GTNVTDFGFTSQRNEASFGLMDYNARYYSPVLGRFVSPDSIVPEPGSSGGFNRYRYTRNNPLKYVDPSGHQEGCNNSNSEDCAPSSNPLTDNEKTNDEQIAEAWATMALIFDGLATVSNGMGALVADTALVVAGPPGYAAGLAIHNVSFGPMGIALDALGAGATTISGIYSGETGYELSDGTLTVTVAQDTVVAFTLLFAGMASPEPNLDTAIGVLGTMYDLGRLPDTDPFYPLPTIINPSFSIKYRDNPEEEDKIKEDQLQKDDDDDL
ncbi:MAG: RHS repeat-associated core domain-containing protein, partial [Deltaproteobacteria bacterium]|nr:RHS repeat-associated core domain-containing protein [Deltaproteobacteria bacterium]